MFPSNGLEHLPLLLGLVALVVLQLLSSLMVRQEESDQDQVCDFILEA